MILISSWQTHFTETEPNEKFQNYTGNSPYTIKSSQSHLYIWNCKFTNVTQTTIFYSSTLSSLMLIEECSFNSCSSSDYGGVVFFFQNGQCVFSSVCGIRSKSGRWGQFSSVYVSSDFQHKNQIIDSSFALTQQTSSDSNDILYHINGNVSCKGVNISKNKVYQYSGILIETPSKSLFSFTSFRNNTALNSNCIFFNKGSSTEIFYSNIIENNHPAKNHGIIETTETSLTMIHCSIFDNCLTEGLVFYAVNGPIICSECSISENQSKSTLGPVEINLTSKFFINEYSFLELDECKRALKIWGDVFQRIPTKPHIIKTDINFYSIFEYIFLLCYLSPESSNNS